MKKKNKMVAVLAFLMVFGMAASIISCVWSIRKISDENSVIDDKLIHSIVSSHIEHLLTQPIIVGETMSKDFHLKNNLSKNYSELVSDGAVTDVASYLQSIKDGFGYQMVFAVNEKAKTYHTYNGISKRIDIENDPHDVWYKEFINTKKHYDLDVDTDEANNWSLSVFVNVEVRSDSGEFLGICGVGVDMNVFKEMLLNFEKEYNIEVLLLDSAGSVQIASDASRIEKDTIDIPFLKDVHLDNYVLKKFDDFSLITSYLKSLDWFLVIRDKRPNKINIKRVLLPNVVIFILMILIATSTFFMFSRQEKLLQQNLKEQTKISLTDELTGLNNRRAFEINSGKMVTEGVSPNTTFLAIDVNGLKQVNDNFGHEAGDELIKGVANSLQKSFGEYGNVYRIGGDEFMAIIECKANELVNCLETLATCSAHWEYGNVKGFTVSKGIVRKGEHLSKGVDELCKMADKLMYSEKKDFYKQHS